MKTLTLLMILSVTALGMEFIAGGCGGEGPHPWSFKETSNKVRTLPTEGKIKDFVYWENRDAVIYRNEKNTLYRLNLRDDSDEYIHRLSQPLSRLVDNRERFLLTKNEPWFLDAAAMNPRWVHFSAFDPIAQHLYWQFNVLYSLAASTTTPNDRQQIKVYVYRAGETRANSCTLETGPGQAFHIAKGHSYPWIYLYQTSPSEEAGKTRLWLYRIKVWEDMAGKPCKPKLEGEFKNPIYGNIKDVHFFDDGNVAIQTDHPTHSLMWWTRTSCKYVNFGGKDVLVPSHAQSNLFTYAKADGLQMYYPDEEQPIVTEVLKGIDLDGIGEDNLSIASSGRKLLVASKAKGSEDRILFEADIQSEFRVSK